MWIWARLSAVGGAAALQAVVDAERPQRGEKLGGHRRGRLPILMVLVSILLECVLSWINRAP